MRKRLLLLLFIALSIPLSAQETEFTLGEGLALDLVASDPDIAQPVYLTFDARGRMWVVQYLQYPFPAGLEVTGHDQYWRVQYDRFPPPPPPKGARGADKITIFEDADADGSFESHKDFLSGLNICTAALPDDKGVWVLNPPYLLYYPDANRDDVPDGDPVVHLEGFGLEDMHAAANSLTWGPDGWLYGCQGSTCTAKISKRPGDEDSLDFQGQCIWRYHPQYKAFELFAEGGYNNFGIAANNAFELFTGSNGGLIGVHYVQGGYYWKNWGKHGPHTNPYTFGHLEAMKDESSRAKLSQAMCFYNDVLFPERLRGKLIVARVMQGRIDMCELTPDGSTYAAREAEPILSSNSQHFRPVDMKLGPDGAVYIADWYDTNVTWSVSAEGHGTDKRSGRIYRLRAADAPKAATLKPPADCSNEELVNRLSHPNQWQRNMAREVLAWRKAKDSLPGLLERFQSGDEQARLESFWTMYRLNEHGSTDLSLLRTETTPLLRAWMLRLVCDLGPVDPAMMQLFQEWANNESDIRVRSQLASSARRLGATRGLPIIAALLNKHDDASDPHLPLLCWWAIEAFLRKDPAAIVSWASGEIEQGSPVFNSIIWPRLARCLAASGGEENRLHISRLLSATQPDTLKQFFLGGIAEAFENGAHESMLEVTREAVSTLLKADPRNAAMMVLGLRLRNHETVWAVRSPSNGPSYSDEEIAALMKALAAWRDPYDLESFLACLHQDRPAAIREAAINALQGYADDRVATALLENWPTLPAGLRNRAASLLTSRVSWAALLIEKVESGTIPKDQVPSDAVANLYLQDDAALREKSAALWGRARATPQEILAKMNAVNAMATNLKGNPAAGKAVFAEACAKCHVLHGEGRQVGPELTGLDRRNTQYLLEAIVDPNRSILPEFMGTEFSIQIEDELGTATQTLAAFVLEENAEVVRLVDTAGNEQTVAVNSIKQRRPMETSVMPEGLLNGMGDEQVRDLFAYLSVP